MSDTEENKVDRPEDDEPLSLVPSEEGTSSPKPPPEDDAPLSLVPTEDEPASIAPAPTEQMDGEQVEGEDDPILLIPVDGEPSREILPLKPLPEEPAPNLPPLFPTRVSPFTDPEPPSEAVERRIKLPEDGEPRKAPSLYPFDLPGMAGWLFSNVNALIWIGATAVLAILLFLGYLLAGLPWIGPTAQVLFGTLGFYLVAAYPFEVVRAALAGAPELPDWSDYGSEGRGRVHAAGIVAVLAICLLPGLILGVLLGRFFGLPLLLAGWTVVPSALLLYAGSGSILAVNPLQIRDALIASGRRYLLAAAPGYVVLIARVIAADGIKAPFILALLFPAMTAAALVVGTLARENDRVGRRLLAIARAKAGADAVKG